MLKLNLEPTERHRLRELRKSPGWPPATYYAPKMASTKRHRQQRYTPLHIALALVMKDLGMTKRRIRDVIGFGELMMDSICNGRVTETRIPDELETGESYCPPTRCEGCGGAMITIMPCRACRTRRETT